MNENIEKFKYRQKYRADTNLEFQELFNSMYKDIKTGSTIILDYIRCEFVSLALLDVKKNINKRIYEEILDYIVQEKLSYPEYIKLLKQLQLNNSFIKENLYEHYEDTYDNELEKGIGDKDAGITRSRNR